MSRVYLDWNATAPLRPEARDAMLKDLMGRKLLVLASGTHSIRFRLPLNISAQEVSTALERVAACLPKRVQA